MSTRIIIAKRDGALEPFDIVKLRRCLATAMRACGCDPRFADALARAVALHLRQLSAPSPPTTDYIFRCVRTALVRTGMEPVAAELARHRRRRAAQRRRVSVWSAQHPQDTLQPWSKGRVADTLERRHGLGHSAARILAAEIERRVLALEYAVVSTTLVNELIQSELLAWGLAGAAAVRPGSTADDAAPQAARKE